MPDTRAIAYSDDKGVSKAENDICVRLGRVIRRLRQKQGWTQTYLAEHLGFDRSYLLDLERGKREVCLRNLEVLAIGFGLSPAQLLGKANK